MGDELPPDLQVDDELPPDLRAGGGHAGGVSCGPAGRDELLPSSVGAGAWAEGCRELKGIGGEQVFFRSPLDV